LAVAALASAASARAATIVPNTGADEYDAVADTDCSLREAIQSGNNFADFGGCVNTGDPSYGGIEILLSGGVTYQRTRADAGGDEDANATGDFDAVLQSLTIGMLGSASSGAVIAGTGAPSGGRIIEVLNGQLNISGVTLRSGNAGAGELGGAISKSTGSGPMTLTGVTVSGNVANGGGGIFTNAPTALTNVTISGNLAADYGGGLYTGETSVDLNNVTVTANTADSDASGTGNGGGLLVDGVSFPLNLSNTIVAGNIDASPGAEMPDCEPGATSLGHNLIGNTTGCSWVSAAGDVLDPPGGPGLAALLGNGGLTQTHALLAGSPAIDAGNPAPPDGSAPECATSDQRGTVRPQGGRCDIGAFEFSPTPKALPPIPTGGKKKCKKRKGKKGAGAAKKCKKKGRGLPL
jgi:CSLREA domain-containing protein